MTPERFKRITDTLVQYQLDLTVCMQDMRAQTSQHRN
ncbi:hypothetical protein WP3W19E03_00390 [Aeromonas veronii]|uniref:Uncharacterized protein n=1 Tax=Aeromonas veronii TaxID=654 RepID=A0A6S5BX54_AERVE|nr:hypothetical protein WP3W19E03_00390 [Aeromonas veronii]